MKVRRPRLLIGSLAVAVVVVAGVAVLSRGGSDESPPLDAMLTDAQGVETANPDEPGLTNRAVEGARFPTDARLSDRDGNAVVSGDLIGQPLVVNFWFSTCAPCAKELPEFAAAHANYGDDVRFVGVNTNDSVEVMEKFAGDRGVNYELYRDDLAELTDGIGAVAFPITIFVTPDGTIVEQTGALDAAELEAKIGNLLAAGA